MDNVISVVFISDDAYAVNTAVTMTSIRENREKKSRYCIYFVAINVESSKIKKICSLSEKGFDIKVIHHNDTIQECTQRGSYVTSAALAKFFLPDILKDLDKVLYLDGDVLVQGDLKPLFDISLGEKYAAVVRDVIAERSSPSIMKRLKSHLKHYFNSGMMLMNLRRMREDGLKEKLIDYKKHGLNYFMDQDALNIVFDENVHYISCSYNYLVAMNEQMTQQEICEAYQLDNSILMAERLTGAAVLHLAGPDKPWREVLPYLTDRYMKYYRLSPFATEDLFHPVIRNKRQREYLFPFEMIARGSNIVLWGAGKVGERYYKQLETSGYCNVLAWVDERYAEFSQTTGIENPECIRDMKTEYVVIAVKHEKLAEEIKCILREFGVSDEKIVWRYPDVE